MSRFVFILAAVVIGCAEEDKRPGPISDAEYSIYSVVSTRFLAHYDSIIVADSTIRQSRYAGTMKFKTESGEWVEDTDWHLLRYRWPELETLELQPSFDWHNSARFQVDLIRFNTKARVGILHYPDTLRGIDEDFQNRIAYIRFSRVAFNDAGNLSLVYLEYYCGHLCGAGNWYLLSKEGASWRVLKYLETWVS
jgi:hypothetical protein